MPFARIASLLVLLAFLAPSNITAAHAQADWIAAVRSGGHVIVFRHGATNPDQADTDPFNWNNIDKQRVLSDAGRAKAKEVGDAIRKLKLPVGLVYVSPINRSIESGKLMFPEITPTVTEELIETAFVYTPNENNRRIAALRKLSSTTPPAGSNAVIVGHRGNIIDAYGKDWQDIREGEASIFKPDGNTYKFVARVQADEWAKLAQ